jgi:ubiquinone/menaquinone biosynthesis C-methylase UbiE
MNDLAAAGVRTANHLLVRRRHEYTTPPLAPARWDCGRGSARIPNLPKRHPAGPKWLRSKDWDEHVEPMEQMADSPGFHALRDRILRLARLRASDRVLDIGAGTGLLALAAAPHVMEVWAVDNSPAMCRHLEAKLNRLGINNVRVLDDSATDLPLADGTVDVVLSNYCFHHLSDSEKRQTLAEIGRVLRPGGRLVFADMMFRVSVTNPRDRAVLRLLLTRMIRRGPGGLMRLLKNAVRIAARHWEHPATVEWWRGALSEAGFVDVDVRALEHEGGIAVAHSASPTRRLGFSSIPAALRAH